MVALATLAVSVNKWLEILELKAQIQEEQPSKHVLDDDGNGTSFRNAAGGKGLHILEQQVLEENVERPNRQSFRQGDLVLQLRYGGFRFQVLHFDDSDFTVDVLHEHYEGGAH